MDPVINQSHEGLKKRTAQSFSKAADQYREYACIQKLSAANLLSFVDDSIRGVCLDVGAGPGVNFDALKQKFDLLISLDLSFDMLKHIPDSNNNAKICADMDALPFRKNSVDAIFSNFATQWSQDLSQLMMQLYHTLKTGGKLYLTIVCDGTLREIEQAWQIVDKKPHINEFVELEQLRSQVLSAGFDIDSFKTQCHKQYFPTALDALKSIKAIGASSVKTGNNSKGLLGKGKLKQVLNAYPKQDEGYCVSYQVAYLVLDKS